MNLPTPRNRIVDSFQKISQNKQNSIKRLVFFISRLSIWIILAITTFIILKGPTNGWRWALGIVFFTPMILVASLRWLTPPSSSIIIQTQWRNKRKNLSSVIQREWVSFSNISPWIILAVCHSEDPDFIRHVGLDWGAILKAISNNKRGGYLAGGSSITQQLAKNLFLWPGRNFIRKGLEIWLTSLMEAFLSKQRILELYLNFAQVGSDQFGVAMGSKTYFGKPAIALDRSEAALLIAALPNPMVYQVAQPSAYLLSRQAVILSKIESGGEDILKFFYGSGMTKTKVNLKA